GEAEQEEFLGVISRQRRVIRRSKVPLSSRRSEGFSWEEGVQIDKKHIGHEFKPFTAVAEAGKLRLFCKAIGEEDPIYQSEEAARKAGYPKMPVAPTFLQAATND